MEHPLIRLSRRYPQLLLPISAETRQSEAYKNAVLRGQELIGTPDFSLSDKDTLEVVETPAGKAEVLTLSSREDFEHCIRALAYRCENREIPKTMGASAISGLINWEKIRTHKQEYLSSGGTDWDAEFSTFTSDSKNYRDSLMILSSGSYSAVSAEAAGYDNEEWLSMSLEIRKYHELAHFTSQRLFPDNKDAVRDEVLADMNGIIAAIGHFDAALAGKFLGVLDGKPVSGGRLELYVPPQVLPAAAERVGKMLEVLDQNYSFPSKPFEILLILEKEKQFL